MQTVTVELGTRSYPVYVGQDLLSRADLFAQYVAGRHVLIVSNEIVAPLYLDKLKNAFKGKSIETHILKDGEQHKDLAAVADIFDTLINAHQSRDTTVVALGGGVTGDIAGFAAACYQRGVNFIQIPTSLLAQVDASVGGKTGVNHPEGKNLIGAFHQPVCVAIDTSTLTTLPEREYRAGIAEIIKYGAIVDADFFSQLEKDMGKLLAKTPEVLSDVISRCCAIKAQVVAADEREAGQRAFLNFGHTFGHALEKIGNYTELLHGEAVAAGMVLAAKASEHLDGLATEKTARLAELLAQAGLPITPPPGVSAGNLLDAMTMDKKALSGELRLILLRDLGEAFVSDPMDKQALQALADKILS
ncbi:MAG: 3-dehydroquinate synthase [Gammaproteobacteria bacterium]|nr:3-dehydroquinate synthase [Gammaproteobacteria bacterium]